MTGVGRGSLDGLTSPGSRSNAECLRLPTRPPFPRAKIEIVYLAFRKAQSYREILKRRDISYWTKDPRAKHQPYHLPPLSYLLGFFISQPLSSLCFQWSAFDLHCAMDARVRFLISSAQLLSSSAPSTSAHLMLQGNLVSSESATSKHKLESCCNACGTVFVPRQMPKTRIESVNEHHQDRKSNDKGQSLRKKDSDMKCITTECLVCGRYVKKPLPRESPIAKVQRSSRGFQTSSPSGITTLSQSSRRRARARKHASLQDMLARSKGSLARPVGYGLDLMDLMRET